LVLIVYLVTAVIVLCGGFLFFRVEQNAVKRSLKNAAHVSDSNGQLKQKNTELADAKKQLEEDEEA
jgi:cell division protein FtsL